MALYCAECEASADGNTQKGDVVLRCGECGNTLFRTDQHA